MSVLAVLLIAAPFIGSFLGVLIRRLPQDAPVAWARSRCEHCDAVLSPIELVPLLSFALQRGRCRHCGARIDAFHPAVELAALGVAAWAGAVDVWAFDDPLRAVADCALGWTLLALAWIDAQTMLLPDLLTLPLIPAGLAATWWLEPEGLPDAAIGAALGWGVFAGLAWAWRRWRGIDGLGEGDARLLAAAGAWVGWQGLADVVLVAALTAIAATLARRGLRAAGQERLAFGPWLALGIWLVRLYGGLYGAGAD